MTASWRTNITDLARALAPFARLLLLWLGVFQLCRLILIAATWPLRGDATPTLLLQALGVGLRFDLAVGAALTLPSRSGWVCGARIRFSSTASCSAYSRL